MAGPGLAEVGDEEAREVADAIQSRQLSRYRFDEQEGGPSRVYRFEREFEAVLGVKHCLGTNSCTSALLAAFAALGIGPGDEVIVPGYTFIASIAAIIYSKATPVLAEIDESLTLDPDDVRRRVTPRTKAILVVHMLGAPADMDRIGDIAREHGLAVVEDVAQACGGSFRGRRLGSIGDLGAFSLNVFKVITAGDGGVLSTNDTSLFERAFAFHDHGAKPYRLGVADSQSILGLNLRMHELTGAMALAQVGRLDAILNEMRVKKAIFKAALGEGFTYRRLNDAAGDCATVIGMQFDTAETARAVATAIGSRPLIDSGKHYYGNMVQLLNRALPSASCPFYCPAHPSNAEYRAGMLPRTDDLLARSILLTVGVQDSYLGAHFGIDHHMAEPQIAAKAEEFLKLARPLM